MSTNKKAVFKKFNEIYFDLLKTMKENSDKNKDFENFYNKNFFIKKTNIKLFIKVWYQSITTLYKHEIMEGNIDYFIKKDFSKDIEDNLEFSNTYSIDTYIHYFKEIYHNLEEKYVNDFVLKVQSLTLLSDMYYQLK